MGSGTLSSSSERPNVLTQVATSSLCGWVGWGAATIDILVIGTVGTMGDWVVSGLPTLA